MYAFGTVVVGSELLPLKNEEGITLLFIVFSCDAVIPFAAAAFAGDNNISVIKARAVSVVELVLVIAVVFK